MSGQLRLRVGLAAVGVGLLTYLAWMPTQRCSEG